MAAHEATPARVAPVTPAPPPAAAPRPPPARLEAADEARWRELIGTLRNEQKELLASAMAHARLLQLEPGLVRVGFAPLDGMHRRTAERGQKDAEAVLGRMLGVPTRLIMETVTANEATPSVAEQDDADTRRREERILRDSRERPEVLAALRIFKGTVEHIHLLEEEQPEDFTSETEDGEAADS